MKELLAHAEKNKLSIAQVVMANEVAVSGKSEAEINAFIDKITTAMVNIVKTGLAAPTAHAARADQAEDARPATVYKRAMDDKYETAARRRRRRGVRARGLGGERARPSRRHGADRRLGRRDAGARLRARRRRPQAAAGEDPRAACSPAAAIGYLCKHNATLSGAEGGCQAEIGVASAMGAAFIAQAHDSSRRWSRTPPSPSLEHHLGMTCDPVAGFVQVPCIERCAFGAVKAWTGFMIASNEIPDEPPRRLRHDASPRWR